MIYRTWAVVVSTVVVCATGLCGRAAGGDVTDTFDSNNGGWTHVGDSTTPPTFNATGGNPGGYISIFDLAQGQGDFFVAPAKYLGNQSGALNQTLALDLLLSDAPSGASSDVFLTNGTTSLVYVFSPQPTAGSWNHEVLTFNTSDPNWHLGTPTGAAPAMSDFQNVLSSLTALQILGDYHAGTETVGLDNVDLHIAPVPEPGCLSYAAALLVAPFLRRRRAGQKPSAAAN
jgi:hypothetical protein